MLAMFDFPSLNISRALQIDMNLRLRVVSFPALVDVRSITVSSNPSLVNVSFYALPRAGKVIVDSNNLLDRVEFPVLTNASEVFVSRATFANFTKSMRAFSLSPLSCAAGLGNDYLPQNAVICIQCTAGKFSSGGERSFVFS